MTREAFLQQEIERFPTSCFAEDKLLALYKRILLSSGIQNKIPWPHRLPSSAFLPVCRKKAAYLYLRVMIDICLQLLWDNTVMGRCFCNQVKEKSFFFFFLLKSNPVIFTMSFFFPPSAAAYIKRVELIAI